MYAHNILDLPSDILGYIISRHIDYRDRFNCYLVCKKLYIICRNIFIPTNRDLRYAICDKSLKRVLCLLLYHNIVPDSYDIHVCCLMGTYKILKLLLNIVDTDDTVMKSYLEVAIYRGNYNNTRLLLSYSNYDLSIKEARQLALSVYTYSPHIFRLLMRDDRFKKVAIYFE